MQRDLSHRIDELIAQAYGEADTDTDYQGRFANEGLRKAEYVVDDLRYRESQGLVQPERLAYLCIGGADGSEAAYVLSETAISKAVMIEISAEGGAVASNRAADLKRHGKQFVVLQGDATGLLDDALDVVDKWRKSGAIDGLVCSAQGVLHELPARSPGFDLPVFLGKVFRNPDWQVRRVLFKGAVGSEGLATECSDSHTRVAGEPARSLRPLCQRPSAHAGKASGACFGMGRHTQLACSRDSPQVDPGGLDTSDRIRA
jgi:hypothetical protein